MTRRTKAEAHLLEQIRQGDERAWTDVVERYQGRLLTFARHRVNDAALAEDLVQDTFIACLKALDRFRGESGLETFLFTILRRKIIDHYRGRKADVCLLQAASLAAGGGGQGLAATIAAPMDGASWYAQQRERQSDQADALAEALTGLIEGYKKALDFQSLKVMELVFYCGTSSVDAAATLDMPAATVRTFRHRAIARLRERVGRLTSGDHVGIDASVWRTDDEADAILRAVWQAGRLSCPKRSTIGAYLLESLEPAWADYVQFHIERLGCHFCRANLGDLREQTEHAERQALVERVMKSTIGFLHR